MIEDEYVIYSSPNCSYCEQAKRLLDMKNLPYTMMDARSSTYFQSEFVDKGVRTVPQIFLGDRHVGGFQELMGELMK